jgi:hypothetical protein
MVLFSDDFRLGSIWKEIMIFLILRVGDLTRKE